MKQLRKVYTFSFPSTVKKKMEEEKREERGVILSRHVFTSWPQSLLHMQRRIEVKLSEEGAQLPGFKTWLYSLLDM